MSVYTLASYEGPVGTRAGAVIDGIVYDVAALTGTSAYATVMGVLHDWDRAHEAINLAAQSPSCAGQPMDSVTLSAPVSSPGAIYCVGSNYRDHAEEMRLAGNRPRQPDPRALGLEPFFFIKSSHTVAGPGATVRCTDYSTQADWEIELVAVIGRQARDLTVDNALSCVAGYTVGNDLSARDLRARGQVPDSSLFRADWFRHKSFDNSAPMGPWMTPAAFIADSADLPMRLWVNDTLKQDSNSGNMIFTTAEQIAYLSSGITLYPGDLIMTGTPAGVGAGKNEYLSAGDTVRMAITGIGEMSFSIA